MELGAMFRFKMSDVPPRILDSIKKELTVRQRGGEKYGFGKGQTIVLYREQGEFIEIPRHYALQNFSVFTDKTVEGGGAPFNFTRQLRPHQVPVIDEFMGKLGGRAGPYGGILSAPCGCHAAKELLLMADGTKKKAEEILVGDLLMGIDGPRMVLELHRGRQRMAKIIPNKGTPFVVNIGHILTVLWSVSDGARKDGDVIDVSVAEWLLSSKNFQRHTVLYRPRVDHFFTDFTSRDRPIDPYHLGLLLGDGTLTNMVGVTTKDPEVSDECYRIAACFGLECRKDDSHGSRCPTYIINSGIAGRGLKGANTLKEILGGLGLFGTRSGTKFIPLSYLTSARAERLALLAGLIDTDGSLSCGGFDWISKSKQLAEDVVYLSRSLGLAAYMSPCEKRDQHGNGGTYYRVFISGDCSIVPIKVSRKRAPIRRINKDAQRVGFKVELLPEDDYYGFVVGGDHRYLMGDFTWTHNTGKTIEAINILSQLGRKAIVLVHAEFLMRQWEEAILGGPNKPAFTDLRPEDIGYIQQEREDWEDKKIVLAMVETLINRDYDPKFYDSFGVVVLDECVTGESKIQTDKGLIPIADFPLYSPNLVLSFNELLERWEYRRILRWIPRGKRRTLTIRAGSQVIRCTPEHPFLTDKGEVVAGSLRPGMRVRSPVPAGAASSLFPKTGGEDPCASLGDTTQRESRLTAKRGGRSSKQSPRSVGVGVGNRCALREALREDEGELRSGRGFSRGIIWSGKDEAPFLLKPSGSSTVRCLETAASHGLTPRRTPESNLPMEIANGSGQGIRQRDSMDSALRLVSGKTVDSGREVVSAAGFAIRGLRRFFKLLGIRNESPKNGSVSFQKRDGRGGTWMTGISAEVESHFTQRDSRKVKLGLSQDSSGAWDSTQSLNQPESISSFDSLSKARSNGSSVSRSFEPREWGTSFLTVTEIIEDPQAGVEEVFDLEVEGNHNFVADGFLVHNCHRHGAAEWHKAMTRFPARYRIGLSATPSRCLRKDTRVVMEDGSKEGIGDLYESGKRDIRVKSVNLLSGEVEGKDAKVHRIPISRKETLKRVVIQLETGEICEVVCTKNHRFWTGDTYVKAGDLEAGSSVLCLPFPS